MKIAIVSSEAVPFCKTGGLADVAGELPVALAKLGQDVSVFMPKYGSIPVDFVKQFKYLKNFYVDVNGYSEYVGVFSYVYRNVTFYFIDNEKYFNRSSVYGFDDDYIRFGYFDVAVVKVMQEMQLKFDLISLHDWQTGMIAPLIRENHQGDPIFKDTKLTMTIHNAAYQGLCDKNNLYSIFKISMDNYSNGKTRFKDSLSYLKSGLLYADKVTTVSETYMHELQYGENSYGLETLLLYRKEDFVGIVNGIDYDTYNPRKDTQITKPYEKYDVNKIMNKQALQQHFHLKVDNSIPVFIVVSRFTFQKGIELLLSSIDYLMSQKVELIVLGSGERQYEQAFEQYRARYPEQIGIYIGYNDQLAHEIYAGGDILLMPSLFEPCGISQLIALRYGTIPVVRNCGGLHDTVIDYNKNNQQGNGFVFNDYNQQGLRYGIDSALMRYRSLAKWRIIVKNAMARDYSWESSAKLYLELYRGLTGIKE